MAPGEEIPLTNETWDRMEEAVPAQRVRGMALFNLKDVPGRDYFIGYNDDGERVLKPFDGSVSPRDLRLAIVDREVYGHLGMTIGDSKGFMTALVKKLNEDDYLPSTAWKKYGSTRVLAAAKTVMISKGLKASVGGGGETRADKALAEIHRRFGMLDKELGTARKPEMLPVETVEPRVRVETIEKILTTPQRL